MHENKLPEFNPLDLLATAASLQCPGRETTTDNKPASPPPPPVDYTSEDNLAMRKERCSRRTRSTSNLNNSVDSSKLKNKKLENDLKIYKVVLKNELSKMLEEHNYGHPKRNFRYILHDEPFSSAEKETDLKLIDSNCNECRDSVENAPQEEPLVTPDTSCDDNCNRLAPEESCSPEKTDNEQKPTISVESSDNSSAESVVDDMNIDSSSCEDVCEKGLPGFTPLAVLDPVSECSDSFLASPTGEGEDKGALQPISSLGEIRQVDRIESCDDEQTLVDVETVFADSNTPENVFADKVVNADQNESSNTLDGFIVSDLCHSCNSVSNDIEKTSEVKDLNLVTTPQEKTGAYVQERNLSSPVVTGNIKKQTIIRSLLTGETIVVVQKSQNGSKELGKLPLLVDSMQAQRGKGNERQLLDVQKDKSETLLAHLTSPVHPRLASDSAVEVPKTPEKIDHQSCDNKNLAEKSDIEIARQQNRINSEILAGKEISSVGVGTMVISPDKQLPSPLPVANKDRLGLQSSTVHSSLLSKLSNGISEQKAQATVPVIVPHSSLERFNIGQFASVSSNKIGLVKVSKNIPKSPAGVATDNGKKGPTRIKPFDNAAYQQVIKKFPNLVKAYRDDDLLKMAVSPDDVLQCVSTTAKSRSPLDSHISHDHDYCSKSPPTGSLPHMLLADGRFVGDVDREPKLGRPPKNGERRKKPARKTVEGAGSRAASPSMDVLSEAKSHPELKLDMEIKPHSNKRRSSRQKSGRDSSPVDGSESPEIEGQGDGAKIKITGAYQDDFVYFINKTSRNRRRASEQPTVPMAPVIQASDIYIPHLSDADIAALKTKTLQNKGVPNASTGEANMNDEDSKVINTILSMENSQYKDSFGFPLHGLDLTPEQMDILYSAIDEVNTDPSVEKFEEETSKAEPDSPVHVPTSAGDGDTSVKSTPDSSSQLLGNVDNIQMSNMDLILKDASNMKPYLPTLDVSEVQDSISAISTPSAALDSGLTAASVSTTISSDDPTSRIGPIERKPSPENDLAMPSFENSVDFLGVDDMKTDLFPEEVLHEVSPVTPAPTPSSEANAPWIVTVSMFWNDLPAIMLDNLPYVRLVDIYKQILPAKDTGILKKRCQLLGIEVRNCSEMQRYFLVKYGRGYNSKSTLVVAKDDAMRLIAFYVEPQSRPVVGKITVDKMPGSALAAPKLRKPSALSESSCDSTNSGIVSPSVVSNSSSPTSIDQPNVSIKKDKPRSSNHRSPSKRRALIADGESVSKRLRHKKINFRNMVQGIKREDEVKEGESPIQSTSPTDVDTAVVPQVSSVDQTGTLEVKKELNADQTSDVETPSVNSVEVHVQLVKPRSTSRGNLKTCRSHPYVLPRALRSFSVLGRPFRRVKGNFHNGSLHNVLKKRQLNVAVQKSATKLELKNKLESETDESIKHMTVAGLQEELPVMEGSDTLVTSRRASPRRPGLLPIVASDRVRSSGRKRKLKQLYPIENYSFSKKPRKGVHVDLPSLSGGPTSHTPSRPRAAAAPVRTSPRKKRAETTSRLDSDDSMVLSPRSTSEDEENRPKNVITLANGPEFETFTALVGDFNV